MPSCETASIIAFCSGIAGNRVRSAAGHNTPRTLGPKTTPASSWPMIAGWPMRCIPSPRSRPHSSNRMICATKAASECPCDAAGAVCARTAPGSAISSPAQSSASPQRCFAIALLLAAETGGIGGSCATPPHVEGRGLIKRNARQRCFVPDRGRVRLETAALSALLAPQAVDFVQFNHAAGRPAFADYWNFIAPLWVSADTGGVQFIENFRLRHLGWEFP